MEVLLVADKNIGNTYISELEGALESAGINVKTDIETFFAPKKNNYDVVFLQWPELINRWKEPDNYRINVISECLNNWKLKAKVVITRHNIVPHYQNTDLYERLYFEIYKRVDLVVHLSDFSRNDYNRRYYSFCNQQHHAIIPHPIYESLPNEVDKVKAREILGLGMNKIVILAFGALRDFEERDILLKAFKRLELKNKCLVVPRWIHDKLPNRRLSPFKWVKWRIKYEYFKRSSKFNFSNKFVADNDIQLYFNSADVVVIPRRNSLNSGIIPLGFTFGNVVIGNNFGNIGELLVKTGNPTFNFDDEKSLTLAISEAISLQRKGKGIDNKNYGYKNWNSKTVGKLLNNAFQSVLECKTDNDVV